jgi:hypothetical protein
VVNAVLWVESSGTYEVWARVDTTNFVVEEDENNNASGVTFTTGAIAGETPDTGWRSPSSNAATSGGDGDGFEDNPGGAYADGGSWAYSQDGSGDRHIYSDFDIDIPAGATVEGIEVSLDGWKDDGSTSAYYNVQLSWDGGNSWTGAWPTAYLWREVEQTFTVGGTSSSWGRSWTRDQLLNENFRVRIVSVCSWEGRDFYLDWVRVRVTYNAPVECVMGNDPSPWGEDDGKPPGLKECQRVLTVGDFEGNPSRIYGAWSAGGPNAYQHQSRFFYDGSMSMRLNASLGSYPTCDVLDPYLYQVVDIPTEVYSTTTMVVSGQRLVAGSEADCSFPNSAEAADVLYVRARTGGGGNLGNRQQIVDGGVAKETWSPFEMDVSGEFDLASHAGQQLQVYFEAEHDADGNDTWFYLDTVDCNVCTTWPIPEDVDGTASFGGDVRVLVGGIPQRMQGVDVWAYSQGGEVYHTTTIHDSTYHFYNVPAGTYTIYAEVWIGGGLRVTTTSVTVIVNERNYDVNMFLL